MQQFRNIIVGVQMPRGGRFSEQPLGEATESAVNQALELAAMVSARITFFSAVGSSGWLSDSDDNESLESEAQLVLDGLVQRAAELEIEADAIVTRGKAWVELIRQVITGRHDLLIAGTREQGAITRLLFGTTGLKLLRACPCPVWLVKPSEIPEVPVWVVATDLEEVGLDCLMTGISGAQMFHAKVRILHSIDHQLDRRMWHTGLSEEGVEEYRAKTRADAEAALQDQLSQTDYRALKYGVETLLIDGPADICILQAIEDTPTSLVIIGTSGRGGIPGMLIGNTAERLLPELTCSILAIKPDDFICPVALSP
jgi:universal stress protein E